MYIDNIVSKAGQDVLSVYKDNTSAGTRLKTRTLLKCLLCNEFEEQVRHTKNNKISITEGVGVSVKRN